MSRTIVIGDVHGCLEELMELISLVDPTPEDTVVSAGDLLHKGPYVSDTIDYAFDIFDIVVLGNHEEKHMRWLKNEERRKQTGQKNLMQNVGEYPFIELSDKAMSVLRNAKLYYQFRTPLAELIVVHAGVPSMLRSLPSSPDDPTELPYKKRQLYHQLIRTRYEDSRGAMVSMGEETERDTYWAEKYDGRFGHVIFGHQPWMDSDEPKKFPHATGIDLGCVHGGKLCALIVNNETSELGWQTVDAKEGYSPTLNIMARNPGEE